VPTRPAPWIGSAYALRATGRIYARPRT
jgi:hypothetical protein